MISRLQGQIVSVSEEAVELRVNGVCYKILLPPPIAERLAEREPETEIELHIYEFIAIEGNRGTRILMGFETPAQRDFFERLLEVPRFGPRSALRSLSIPIARYAQAIEMGDTKLLRSLPGVGSQKAKDIIATLQGKVGRFVDVAEVEEARPSAARPLAEAEEQAVIVLEQLGMSRADALQAVLRVRETQGGDVTADQIVKAVFRRQHVEA